MGDDLLRLDNSGGLLTMPGGITFDGSVGRDSLLLIGSTAVSSSEYSVGPNSGDGRVVHTVTGPPQQVQTVTFSGLEPLVDLVAAALLTVNATDAANAISYGQGLGVNTGRVAIDGFESIEFQNKSTLTIRGLGGSDEFSLQPASPLGLTSIVVDGGDPTAGSDTAIVNGSGGSDAFIVTVTGSDSATITGAGPTQITLAATERLQLNGQGGADSLRWISPLNSDAVRFITGSSESTGTIEATSSVGQRLLPMSFSNVRVTSPAANLIFDTIGGSLDQLTIVGTDASESVQLSTGGIVSIQSLQSVRLSPNIDTQRVGQLTLQTLAGDDQIFVPGNHTLTALLIDAGDPDSGSDVLNVLGGGGAVTIALATQSITEAGFGAVSFSGIEQLNLNSSGGNITYSTTNEIDLTTYYPEGPNSGRLTNDRNSPRISFSNCGTLTVNQLAGADVLDIQGTASAETMTLNIPARLLSVSGLEPLSFIGGNTEFVRANGQAGNDVFTVTTDPSIPVFVDGGDPIGTSPGDSILLLSGAAGVVFEPGPESDEGAFLVGTNQRLSFDHIESLTVSGPGAAWIAGTGGDDDIRLSPAMHRHMQERTVFETLRRRSTAARRYCGWMRRCC
ncbi:MAG UNVERIFIED_CONTAM: hypothetical protein LVR18_04640 [Planctomycetaceae bacterium]